MLFAPASPLYLPVPHEQQRKQADCLVACVRMVCQYWRISLSYSSLSALLETDPDFGTPFPHLERLRRYNLQVQIGTGTLKYLYRLLHSGQPIVVAVHTSELPYWRNESTQHAVVVVGMTPTQILLNDPVATTGPIGIGISDFDLAWLAQDERFGLITPR